MAAAAEIARRALEIHTTKLIPQTLRGKLIESRMPQVTRKVQISKTLNNIKRIAMSEGACAAQWCSVGSVDGSFIGKNLIDVLQAGERNNLLHADLDSVSDIPDQPGVDISLIMAGHRWYLRAVEDDEAETPVTNFSLAFALKS